MAVGILFWLILVAFGSTCVAQRDTLTTSSPTATEGSPFTFIFTSPFVVRSMVNPHAYRWTAFLRTGKRLFFTASTRNNQCVIPNFNFTCNIGNNVINVTVPVVDFQTYHGSNWSCFSRYFGDSNTITMEVNVPTTTMIIKTTSPLSMIEGESISLVCETNPTRPPSNITWMIGNETVTRGVTSRTRIESELTVTVGILTMKAMWKDNQKIIQCVGQYNDTLTTSSGVKLITNVPLADVNIFMNKTADDVFTLTCETNPTYPPSRIAWMKGSHALQSEVTSESRDENGQTQTYSVISVSCEDTMNVIYCIGIYMDGNRTSLELADFIQCTDLSACLGAGAGIGVAVFVALLALVVLGMYVYRRHGLARLSPGGKENEVGSKHTQKKTKEMNATELKTVKTVENSPNIYDEFDETTRQKEVGETYEAMRLYENTGNLSK